MKNLSGIFTRLAGSSDLDSSTCGSPSSVSPDPSTIGEREEEATDDPLVVVTVVLATVCTVAAVAEGPVAIAGEGVDALLKRQTRRTPWNLES